MSAAIPELTIAHLSTPTPPPINQADIHATLIERCVTPQSNN